MLVADTNVLIELFLPSPFCPLVLACRDADDDGRLPSLWVHEFRSVLLKFLRAGRLDLPKALNHLAVAEQKFLPRTIAVPEGSILSLDELGLLLPTNWNVRPVGPNAQSIGGEFLKAVDQAATEGRQICGVRVPSVISTTDSNVLLDPRQRKKYRVADWVCIPFNWLVGTAT